MKEIRLNPLSARDLITVLAVVVVWGVNFVVMKVGLRDFTPFQLGAARFVFAVVPLLFFLKPPRVKWWWVVLYGAVQGVGQFGLLFLALRFGMTAALASVLMQTQIFFTAFFAFVLLKERASRPLHVGLTLAALGLACFVLNYTHPGVSGSGPTTRLGLLLTLLAAGMWALANIVVRRLQQLHAGYSPIALIVWSSSVAIVPFLLLSLLFDPGAARGNWLHASWSGWMAAAYLGWCSTIMGYGLWTDLIKRHPANRIAPFSLAVPVVGLAAGMIVLGEKMTPWQWAGIVLLVAALACVVLGGLSAGTARTVRVRSSTPVP